MCLSNEQTSKTIFTMILTNLLSKNKPFNATVTVGDHDEEYGILAIAPFSDRSIDYLLFGAYEENGQRKCITVDHTSAEATEKQLQNMLVSLPDQITVFIDDEY